MKSGCCAGLKVGADGIPALDALPLSALTGSPPSRHVLAKRSAKTLSRFTSALMFTGIVTDIGEIAA
jgi:hypothetical protein